MNDLHQWHEVLVCLYVSSASLRLSTKHVPSSPQKIGLILKKKLSCKFTSVKKLEERSQILVKEEDNSSVNRARNSELIKCGAGISKKTAFSFPLV